MIEKMIQNLEAKTGKSLKEWVAVVQEANLTKHMEKVNLLKKEHGLTHGYANMIVHTAKDGVIPGTQKAGNAADDLIATQYEKKADLRPIYDKIILEVQKFGKDVEIAPKKAYVSLRRKKQFALIQPSTKTRVDIGINNKAAEVTDRMEASGSFNSMVSHRVRLTDAKEVDAQLIGWLRLAYESAG